VRTPRRGKVTGSSKRGDTAIPAYTLNKALPARNGNDDIAIIYASHHIKINARRVSLKRWDIAHVKLSNQLDSGPRAVRNFFSAVVP
jgi:hypothetical protein